jgi:hypothetical protein
VRVKRELGESGAQRAHSELALARLVENIDSLYRDPVNKTTERRPALTVVSVRSAGREVRKAT